MRKQTKIVAVASAAALLAIGASMTSFAAYGWVQEDDGAWYFYDHDGNRVEDVWKKSGDNWYWLSSEENGAMAVDTLVEDEDDLYYVDSNGVMVRNTWIKIVNEDQDDDDDPAEYNYYYMQSNGKAYKNSSTGNLTKKLIDGKYYAFDDEGKMLYGWVDNDGNMQNGEDDWMNGVYYFGNWDDGAMKTGWQQIYVHDERTAEKSDDYYYWFNFKPNGKKRTNNDANGEEQPNKTWKSNGHYYHFDKDGVMVYQWYEVDADASGSNSSASNWAYFGDPEDGARKVKGWFKVIAANEDNTYDESDYPTFASTDATDETERWYYSEGYNKGLVVGEIKKIKGKYYGFRPEGSKGGSMLTGLCALYMDPTEGYKIKSVLTINGDEMADMDSDKLSDFMDWLDDQPEEIQNQNKSHLYLYYFGNDEDTDGAMKTGNVTINLDGDSYQFLFKKGGSRDSIGRGRSGIEDKKYIYRFGMRLKADSDEKYKLVKVTGDEVLINGGDAVITTYDGTDIANQADTIEKVTVDADRDKKDQRSINAYIKFRPNMYLVNTSGRIQTGSKSGVKDGNGCYWYMFNDTIRMYTDDKDLSGSCLANNKWHNIGEDNSESKDADIVNNPDVYDWTFADLPDDAE